MKNPQQNVFRHPTEIQREWSAVVSLFSFCKNDTPSNALAKTTTTMANNNYTTTTTSANVQERSSLTGGRREDEFEAEFTGSPVSVADVYACKVIYVYKNCLVPITAATEILELGSFCCVSPRRVIELFGKPLLHRILFFGFFVLSIVNLAMWYFGPRWLYFLGASIGMGMITIEMVLELILFFFVDIWMSLYWNLFLVFFLKTDASILGLTNNFIRFRYSSKTSLYTTDFETHALFAYFEKRAEVEIMVYNRSWSFSYLFNRTMIPTFSAFLIGLLLIAPYWGSDIESLGTDEEQNLATLAVQFFFIYIIGFYIIKAALWFVVWLLDCLTCGLVSGCITNMLAESIVKKLKERNNVV